MHEMNDQELANLCYCAKRTEDFEFLRQNHEIILKKAAKMSLRSMSVVLHCYSDELVFVPCIPMLVDKMNEKGFGSLVFSLTKISKKFFNDQIYDFLEICFLERKKEFGRNKLINCNMLMLLAGGERVNGSEKIYKEIYENMLVGRIDLGWKDLETLLYYFKKEKISQENCLIFMGKIEEIFLRRFGDLVEFATFDNMTKLFLGVYRVVGDYEFKKEFFDVAIMNTLKVCQRKDEVFGINSLINLISVVNGLEHKLKISKGNLVVDFLPLKKMLFKILVNEEYKNQNVVNKLMKMSKVYLILGQISNDIEGGQQILDFWFLRKFVEISNESNPQILQTARISELKTLSISLKSVEKCLTKNMQNHLENLKFGNSIEFYRRKIEQISTSDSQDPDTTKLITTILEDLTRIASKYQTLTN
jgi:hypothetical protein